MTKACHPQADAKNYRPIPPNSIVTILRRVGGWDRQFLTSKAKTGFHPGKSSNQLPTHQAIWKMVCQNTTTNLHYQPTTNIFANQLPTTKYLLGLLFVFFLGKCTQRLTDPSLLVPPLLRVPPFKVQKINGCDLRLVKKDPDPLLVKVTAFKGLPKTNTFRFLFQNTGVVLNRFFHQLQLKWCFLLFVADGNSQIYIPFISIPSSNFIQSAHANFESSGFTSSSKSGFNFLLGFGVDSLLFTSPFSPWKPGRKWGKSSQVTIPSTRTGGHNRHFVGRLISKALDGSPNELKAKAPFVRERKCKCILSTPKPANS